MRQLAVSILSLAVLATSTFAQSGPGDDATPSFADGVREYAAVNLNVPMGSGVAHLSLAVPMDGSMEILDLSLRSMRAEGFVVQTQTANGFVNASADPPATYRGHLRGRPGSLVAATVRNGELHAHVREADRTWFVQPLEDGGPGAHAVYNGDDVIATGICGCDGAATQLQSPRPEPLAGETVGVVCLPVTEIAFDADYEYFLLNNGSIEDTIAEIEILMNAVDLIYGVELGIGYEITEIKVRTMEADPYSALTVSGILDEFRAEWNANCVGVPRDVAHLMTGKATEFAGIAFNGAICHPTAHYGVDRATNPTIAVRINLLAHELGHNWGATHCNEPGCPPDEPDCDGDCAIMCGPTLFVCDGRPLSFGIEATAEILAFQTNVVTCVEPTIDSPVIYPSVGHLLNEEGAPDDQFGRGVDIAETENGIFAVVGSPFRDREVDKGKKEPTILLDTGSVFVYRFDGPTRAWDLFQEIQAFDFEQFDRFGLSVGIDGDVIVVGAPLDDDGGTSAGSVYVYRWSGGGFEFEEKLTADDPQNTAVYGEVVDVSGNYIAIGAPRNDEMGVDAGAVYIREFDGTAWGEEVKITNEDGMPFDEFGTSVAIWDDPMSDEDADLPDLLIIGSPRSDVSPFADAGRVYGYKRGDTEWELESQVQTADPEFIDQFGNSVDVGRNRAVVGCWNDNEGAVNGGAAYILRRFPSSGSWGAQTKILSPAPSQTARFGSSVAIADDFVVVGAHRDDVLGTDSGAAYAFGLLGVFGDPGSVWEYLGHVASIPIDTGVGAEFGINVAASGSTAIVGAFKEDIDPNIEQGAADAFFVGVDCDDNGFVDVCEIAVGLAIDCDANGLVDACEIAANPDLDLDMDGILDVCFSDCNGNFIPDFQDIDPTDPDGNGMVSEDCDLNGEPDECQTFDDCDNNGLADVCEILADPSLDCNGNGSLDSCDIVDGTSEDCNNDSTPDECSLFIIIDSPMLGPIGNGSPQSWTFAVPPFADTDVTVRVSANADLNETTEYFELYVDDDFSGLMFQTDVATQCPVDTGLPLDVADEFVGETQWNLAAGDGSVTVRVEPIQTVDADQCVSSFIQIRLAYPTGDCNGNQRPDDCDLADGILTDDNFNGIPDQCEICELDLNGDLMIDVDELLAVLASWGPCPGCPADFNADGVVDINDLLDVLGAWGPCL